MGDQEQIHTHDEFREHVKESLASIKSDSAHMVSELRRMNGTQVDLIVRMRQAEITLATIHTDCPLQGKVGVIEEIVHRRVTEDATRNALNAKWLKWIKPILYLLAGALIMLLINHPDVFKVMK
jgi:hypothetical protein